jgi:hypothetical protein
MSNPVGFGSDWEYLYLSGLTEYVWTER